MSSTALRRGAPPQRRRKAAPRKAPAPMVRVPMRPRAFYLRALGGLAALGLAAAATVAWMMGIPQGWWFDVAQAAGRAGFEVRHVEVAGVKYGPKLPVYAAALDGPTNSMLMVDLEAARTRLKALPWVADATVTRRLPDTLRVEVTERQPVALWQYRQRLAVIDRSGAVLTSDGLERFKGLPMVVGQGANTRARDLLVLLADRPGLAPKVDAATFVGNRRWDLRFKTGETLALPEGDPAAAKALASFEKLDRTNGLLARGFARFDMRLPGKMTVRVAGDPGAPVKPVQELAV